MPPIARYTFVGRAWSSRRPSVPIGMHPLPPTGCPRVATAARRSPAGRTAQRVTVRLGLGLIDQLGVGGIAPNRVDATQRAGLGLVRLTHSDDLPVAGLEPERRIQQLDLVLWAGLVRGEALAAACDRRVDRSSTMASWLEGRTSGGGASTPTST